MVERKLTLSHGLHILVLFAFAVGQPIFDLLTRFPEFFVARHSEPVDILVLTVALSLLIPGLMVSLVTITALVSRRVHRWVHSVMVAVLLAAIVLQALKNILWLSGSASISVALLIGGAIAIFYTRSSIFHKYLTILSPAVLIFPAVFLLNEEIGKITFPERPGGIDAVHVEATNPLVMVVFDELPLVSLLNEKGTIDAGRYPNFAGLAQDSYWFRNATTISDATLVSIPAILTGILPEETRKQLPIWSDHPRNLFTVLQNSYELNVFENSTRLHQETKSNESAWQRWKSLVSDLTVFYGYLLLPSDLTSGLPSISQTWGDFVGSVPENYEDFEADLKDRGRKFEEFLTSIQAGERRFYFLHSMLPHLPWIYLPGGKRYSWKDSASVPGTVRADWPGKKWLQDEWLVTQGYQRHLLQVGFADMLLGQLISRLKHLDLYDRSLIVITADHGVSFRRNEWMRGLSESNAADILPIPLFIKTPHQKTSMVSDRNVETIDIFPSILDVLDVDIPWEVSGRSALDFSAPPRTEKTAFMGHSFRYQFDGRLKTVFDGLRRKIRIFGSGSWDDLFAIGPYSSLLGRRVRDIGIAGRQERVIEIFNHQWFERVRLDSPFVPARIVGRFAALPPPGEPIPLAVSLNGVVHAVTQTSPLLDGGGGFSAMVPAGAFREERNEIEVFLISTSETSGRVRLFRVKSALLYEWGTLIRFDSGGAAKRFLREGWSEPEGSYTWTRGHQSSLGLEAAKPAGSVLLSATISPFLRQGRLDEQNVIIRVNGREAGRWRIRETGYQTRTLLIPAEWFTGDRIVLTFEFPDAASPAELGLSGDKRILGLAFQSLRLSLSGESR